MTQEHRQRIILGIDPGTLIMGYGVILVDERCVHYVDMGVIDLRKEKDHFAKLKKITRQVGELIETYHPTDLAVESLFYGHNAQVILKLGRAQGAAIAAALAKDIPVFEYAPRKAKMAITGNGAASKEQVCLILERTLKISFATDYLDASDALAIAMCHYYQLTSPLSDAGASSSWEKFVKEHPGRVKTDA
ncbi:MAG: crossover junction endodeoxyribonuclease RuvC [Alistipes sp.]|nr:crossover junction endodeoxyribonuclease RuvC [Candidatus Minthomonas equi]